MTDHVSRSREALRQGDISSASLHCQQALNDDGESYAALVLAATIAGVKGETTDAELLYKQASELNPEDFPAFEGLAQLQTSTNNVQQGVQTWSYLIKLARTKSAIEKQREFMWRCAEAEERINNLEGAQSHLHDLLKMPLDTDEQRLEALCFLADVQTKVESEIQQKQIRSVEKQQQKANKNSLRRSLTDIRLSVDANRCDEQIGDPCSLAHTLKEIVQRTIPNPHYARYFERHLQIYLSRLGAFPPRSSQRQDARMLALKECARMITTSAGGCTTPFPFEAAIWLLEEQEELYGGTFPIRSNLQEDPTKQARSDLQMTLKRINSRRSLSSSSLTDMAEQPVHTRLKWYRGNSISQQPTDRVNIRHVVHETINEGEEANQPIATQHETFGVKLAHQFPWLGSAQVAVSLALRRRFLAEPDAPSTGIRRKQITKGLLRGMQSGAHSAAGWKALAELQYQNRDWQGALDSACSGLAWHAQRRTAGHETLTGFALSLRLCSARCLRRLNRLDEAEEAFKTLAGWTTDGECGFDELSGSAPTSVRQQALRGIAKIALQRGDTALAKSTYERILGKALMGRGKPAEHWAYAEYAWLQFQDNDFATARTQLEKALEEAEKEGCGVTEAELADHQYKMGRTLWALGGASKSDPSQCRVYFELASVEECDSQEAACMWLGRWYHEVGNDLHKAKGCYEEALVMNPKNKEVALALREINQDLGMKEQADELAHLTDSKTPTRLSIDGANPSAFAAASSEAFDNHSKQDKSAVAAKKLVATIAERVSSGRIPLSMQSAHSANSELAAYTSISRINSRPTSARDPNPKPKSKYRNS